MTVYYNDIEPFACSWLRELQIDGLIPEGTIDSRSILDLEADGLAGHRTVHLFAGIGGWAYALRLAGLPDDLDVWTVSCPCQPFSVAGRGAGTADERHLWPAVRRLVEELRPPILVGEQVASRDGRLWLAGVRADLEQLGYAVGAADLCAAGVGAPHIRQRLYWVGRLEHAESDGRLERRTESGGRGTKPRRGADGLGHAESHGWTGRQNDEDHRRRQRALGHPGAGPHGVAHAGCERDERRGDAGELDREGGNAQGETRQRQRRGDADRDSGTTGRMADAHGAGRGEFGRGGISGDGDSSFWDHAHGRRATGGVGHALGGAWADSAIIACLDGKRRRMPLEPALFPLAHGVPNRVGTLRGAGNAIVPQVAAEFLMAALS